MAQQSWNVKNTVTEELIADGEGVAIEYDTEALAQTSAVYHYQATGDAHIVVGPHPKPHA